MLLAQVDARAARPARRSPEMDWIDDWIREGKDAQRGMDVSDLRSMLRLSRIALLGEAFQNEVLERFELTTNDHAVLTRLRSAGRPYALKPSQLYTPLRLSSGGMTKILRRLERSGFVERHPEPEDGRSVRIQLTARGLAVHDRALRATAAAATRLLGHLAHEERAELDRTLARLIESLERGGPEGEPTGRPPTDPAT